MQSATRTLSRPERCRTALKRKAVLPTSPRLFSARIVACISEVTSPCRGHAWQPCRSRFSERAPLGFCHRHYNLTFHLSAHSATQRVSVGRGDQARRKWISVSEMRRRAFSPQRRAGHALPPLSSTDPVLPMLQCS